jgi:hypothetical protein
MFEHKEIHNCLGLFLALLFHFISFQAPCNVFFLEIGQLENKV